MRQSSGIVPRWLPHGEPAAVCKQPTLASPMPQLGRKMPTNKACLECHVTKVTNNLDSVWPNIDSVNSKYAPHKTTIIIINIKNPQTHRDKYILPVYPDTLKLQKTG